jgi:hypothetical protein
MDLRAQRQRPAFPVDQFPAPLLKMDLPRVGQRQRFFSDLREFVTAEGGMSSFQKVMLEAQLCGRGVNKRGMPDPAGTKCAIRRAY